MKLHWYQWMALAALCICMIMCLLYFIRLINLGKPVDYSRSAGQAGRGIRWAFTGAMSPTRKESAFLHLPTYAAGLLYHMGNFLSFFLFFFIISGIYPTGWIALSVIIFLAVSSSSGIGILARRIVSKQLRTLSNPDDYISNILVTLFQLMTFIILWMHLVQLSSRPTVQLIYYLVFTTLALYIPVGKLRHTVYFFAARYHLGLFFGRRGVWPPAAFNSGKNQKTNNFL